MSKKCVACGKSVYYNEQVGGVDVGIHTQCFYCQYPSCNVKLAIQTYAAVDKKLYCPTHFKQLTAEKKYVGQDTPVKSIPKVVKEVPVKNSPPISSTPPKKESNRNENGLVIDNTGKPVSNFGKNENHLTRHFSDVRSGLKKTIPRGYEESNFK